MDTPSSPRCVGVLLPMDSTYTRLAMRGLKLAAQQHGLHLVLYSCLTTGIFDHLGKEVPLASIGYDSSRLIGTISFFGGTQLIEQLSAQHRAGHPTVMVLRGGGGAVPHVLPDDEPAIEALIVRLHRHGHRRIAHLRGPLDNPSAERRFRGYKRGLAKAGLPFDPDLVFETAFSGEQSFRALTEALEHGLGVTAVLAGNDAAAFGALRAAIARGVSIPGQLEVVGYDNHVGAALCEPPLSTFEIPLEEMARTAVTELVAQIQGRAPRLESFLAPLFLARSTTRFTDHDAFLDFEPAPLPPEGPLPPPLLTMIEGIPSDSPLEKVLVMADAIVNEGIRLDADLSALVQAIIHRARQSRSPGSSVCADRHGEILSAALGLTLTATRIAHVKASEHAQTFNDITQRLREGALDRDIVADVLCEALGASGFFEAKFHLKTHPAGMPGAAPGEPAGKLHHWDLVAGRNEVAPATEAVVQESALDMARRHPVVLVLPLIIGTEVAGHIITDGHSRFRPELARLVREVTSALYNFALHEELMRSNATLRESEYFYASLVESLPQIIVRKDASGRVTYANAAFSSIVGYPLDPQKVKADDVRVLTTGETIEEERTYVIDGQPKQFRVHKSPLRAPDGAITGVQVIFWDVTSFRQTETQLRETQRELIEVSRRAGIAEIATGILHNIGNGLNSVNTSAGVIAERLNRMKAASVGRIEELLVGPGETWRTHFTEDERGRKIVEYIRSLDTHLRQSRADALNEIRALREGVDHVNQIVAAQQQFAQVSAVVDEFAPSEAADYALRLCETEFLRHGIVVARDYQSAPRVHLERHKVIQILVNLIRNAKDALVGSGQREKTIRIGTRTAADGLAQIFVEDNGVGIDPDALPLIFSMGFTTKPNGHGFGLHNSALTATSLGGALRVESEGPGRGARFSLNLPPADPAP